MQIQHWLVIRVQHTLYHLVLPSQIEAVGVFLASEGLLEVGLLSIKDSSSALVST